MWWVILAIFACAALAPAIVRRLGRGAPWLLAAVPLAAFAWLGSAIPALPTGPPAHETFDWVPSLGVRVALHLDGLSLLFALLVTGIGALVVIYAGAYGITPARSPGFHATLLCFMGSMLGVVLADDVIALFVFWELTSVTSYLLIATSHEDPRAIRNARQALLITASGGLALLAGLVLLADAAGTAELSSIVAESRRVSSDPRYLAILVLIAAGAFTKSAIAPFHFWLPNAMAAPTPVSAYLHSATMVKAGVYLLARMRPVLGGTEEWMLLLGIAGAATIGLAASRVLRQIDLKSILAETTVIALGALVMMLAMPEPHAATAAVVFLVVHALYKASLFMLAGVVDRHAGTRDLRGLGGLGRAMPRTAAIAAITAFAMMGLPPMFGFIGKELVYEATLGTDRFAPLWTIAAFVGNVLTVSGALLVVHRTFAGPVRGEGPRGVSDAPLPMLAAPAVLASASVVFGVFHAWTATQLVTEAVRAIDGPRIPVQLRLWHGFGSALALSVTTLVVGIALYRRRSRAIDRNPSAPAAFGSPADRAYDRALALLARTAELATRAAQTGDLRRYVLVTASCAAVLPAVALGWPRVPSVGELLALDVPPFELTVLALIGAASALAVAAPGRIGPLVCVMVVGYGVGLVFVIAGAPDVAFTQLTVETLLVVFVTVALARIRGAAPPRRARGDRARDTVVATALGATVAALLLGALALPFDPSVSAYFAARSVPGAHGHNVVNTILVDFRALDTLGEITVLAAAALGAAALGTAALLPKEGRP